MPSNTERELETIRQLSSRQVSRDSGNFLSSEAIAEILKEKMGERKSAEARRSARQVLLEEARSKFTGNEVVDAILLDIYNNIHDDALLSNVVVIHARSDNKRKKDSLEELVAAAIMLTEMHAIAILSSTEHNYLAYLCSQCYSVFTCNQKKGQGMPFTVGVEFCCPSCYKKLKKCILCGHITGGRGGEGIITTRLGELCISCLNHSGGKLDNWNYRPNLQFNRSIHNKSGQSRELFFGVELEVEMPNNGFHKQLAVIDLHVDNTTRSRYYIKHDGSLTNGFEVVTQPTTLECHLTEFPWKGIIEILVRHGADANKETCGLHVHYSSSWYGGGQKAEEAGLKAINIIDNNWTEIVKFSNRKAIRLHQWSGCSFAELDMLGRANPNLIQDFMQVVGSRYKAVNVMNLPHGTLEFRMFQSTLDLNKIFAYLEFTDFIARLSRDIKVKESESINWNTLIQGYLPRNKYPYLWTYLKKRRMSCGVKKISCV